MQYFLFCTTIALTMRDVMNGPVVGTDMSDNRIPTEEDFIMVSRSEWKARAPLQKTPLVTPVPYVIIHHTQSPGACTRSDRCSAAMRSMQNYHMDDRGWWDIGYNFCVGGDGKVYEGRGWTTVGAHALNTNSVSIGICLIGDWTNTLPPPEQLDTAKALIRKGLELGYVRKNYTLLGHRQVRDTDCPGDALFAEIEHWDHFSPYPASYLDPLHTNPCF